MLRPLRTSLALAVVALSATAARAQTLVHRAPPQSRVVHRSLLALRGNPLGLLYDGRLAYRLRLYQDDSLALRDNFLGGGAAASVTPAYVKVGPYVELAPASIATVWASFQYVSYFGSSGLLQSFDSPTADFSDDELDRRADLPDGDPLKNYGASGTELTLGLDLQARVGAIAVRSSSRLVRADLDLRDGDTAFYDQSIDLLLPDDGWAVTTDLDAAYLGMGGRLVAGVRYSAAVPLYADDAFRPGEAAEHDNTTQRVGPVLAYSFYSTDGRAFNAPTILVIAQWWLDHRYRTGAETSQGIPLVAVGLRFHGDLLALD